MIISFNDLPNCFDVLWLTGMRSKPIIIPPMDNVMDAVRYTRHRDELIRLPIDCGHLEETLTNFGIPFVVVIDEPFIDSRARSIRVNLETTEQRMFLKLLTES